MNHKEEVRLNRLLSKMGAMYEAVQCMVSGIGTWDDGTGKNRLVYQVDKSEFSDVRITTDGGDWADYYIHLGGTKIKFKLSDDDLLEVIREGIAKVTKKAVKTTVTKKPEQIIDELKKQVRGLKKRIKELESSLEDAQSEIHSLKEKYEPQTENEKYEWDENTVTYLDVYRRVVEIMRNRTGYAPDDVEDAEDGEIDICVDFDGNEHKTWTNARAFVGGDEEETSIFEEVWDLDSRYDKLASRWDAEFCDACRILGEVNVEDTSPVGIMKALDEAGL